MNGVIIYLTIKYNRKHTKLAEDQLDLARQQAAVRPKVEFLTAYLRRLEDEPDLYDEVREELERLQEHRRERQQEAREREAAKRARFPYFPTRAINVFSPHGGPYPNYCLCVRISNSGGIAAKHVTGWVEVDRDVLEPVDHFLDNDVEILNQRRASAVKLRLTVPNEEGTLLVGGEAEHIFRIPVVLHSRKDLSLPWELSNSQEEPKSGTFHLPISTSTL